jgi:DNA-binding FrmR family transcriptional regulator
METKRCHDPRRSHHDNETKKKLVNRLKRIEGQISGVIKMIEEDQYCDDILTQISAVRSALGSAAELLFKAHLNTCILEQIRSGSDEIMNELQATIKRLMKN